MTPTGTPGIRVAVDASNLRAGGGRTHLVELLRAADAARDNIEQVTVWGSRDTLARLPKRDWLRATHVPDLDGGLARRALWQAWSLRGAAAHAGDVLFSPGGLAPRTPQPTVVMCRSMLPFDGAERRRYARGERLRLETLRALQASSFVRSSATIFLSRYAMDAVLPQLVRRPERVVIIPHGVDPAFRKASPRETSAISEPPPTRLRLLYVSYLTPYKHQCEVLRAVADLRQRFPVSLDFVGQADTSAYCQEFARLLKQLDPLGEWATHRNTVPHAELPSIYHAADAFIYASSCENFPNVLLEAMASGLPILSSDRGPMPEILGDAGIYFDPESVDSIAGALAELVGCDPARRTALATRGERRAAAFTWERCCKATFRVLAAVVSGRGRIGDLGF